LHGTYRKVQQRRRHPKKRAMQRPACTDPAQHPGRDRDTPHKASYGHSDEEDGEVGCARRTRHPERQPDRDEQQEQEEFQKDRAAKDTTPVKLPPCCRAGVVKASHGAEYCRSLIKTYRHAACRLPAQGFWASEMGLRA
jgi:hypothetical protein